MSHKALYFSKIVVKKLRVDFNSNECTLHNNDPTAALVSVSRAAFLSTPSLTTSKYNSPLLELQLHKYL